MAKALRYCSSFCFLGVLLCATSSYACTNITIKAKDGTVMVGRTQEFGADLHSRVMSSARGRVFNTTAPDGKAGLSWRAKYGYVLLDFFGQGRPIDGINEKGLSFGYLYLPGYTQYQTVPKGKDNSALNYAYFGDWLLSNFDSVAQVKASLNSINVFAQPVTMGSFTNMIFPLHAIITDDSGKSIVVEFKNGAMQVYDNKLGVLTNSPTFDWQETNLKNYANLSPYSPKKNTITHF